MINDLIRYTSMELTARYCQCECRGDEPHLATALVSAIIPTADGLTTTDYWACSPVGIHRATDSMTRLANVTCVIVSVMTLGAVSMPIPIVAPKLAEQSRRRKRRAAATCAKTLTRV